MFGISIRKFIVFNSNTTLWFINNLREKFSPGPGFEPGSPALRAGAITTKPPRRITGPTRNSSLIGSPPYPPEALVPSIRDGGEHLCWHYFN